MTCYCVVSSPLEELLLVGDAQRGLTGVYMRDHRRGPQVGRSWTRDERPFAEARRQLEQYFAGERLAFDLRLAPAGTPFQTRVWEQLARIPFGTTVTYGELAGRVGLPGGARAVGTANARNPISIVLPCHRVVGTAGGLTGYAGGLERKHLLLAHERAVIERLEGATHAGTGGANRAPR